MLLSSIEIQGFKSFADKTVLKFGKGITAVVGPNGSGKSNISDAVRWVLGEQSTKSLRGQSMEDVIFGGTETRRPHGFCEVTININNTDRTLNFDNDFVAVTRRFYRSHESEYSINNVSVRLKDIHNLFMDTGLGRDGYSMIGQGKIDTIISSKSGERRDIFEEAAGISKYRYRKSEAEKKLLAAEDNLLRLHDILDELKSRVGPLSEQSKKAQEFLELSDSKKELEIGLWLFTLENSKQALRNQESKIAAARLSYNQIEEELEQFDEKSEKNTSFFAKLTSDIEGERLSISNLNQEIVKQNGNITVTQNNVVHNNESIYRLKKEISDLNISDDNAKKEISDNLQKAEEINNTIKLNKEQQFILEKSLSELITNSEDISRNIENKIRELNTLSAKSSDKRVEMVTADTAITEITNRNKAVLIENEEKNKSISELEVEFDKTNEFLNLKEDFIVSSQNVVNGYTLKLKSNTESSDNLKAKLDELKLDIESKKRKIQFLKDLENNMEGFIHSVKIISKQSSLGTLKGIYGPVSKIIEVDRKYSTAIETALGNAIQNIVVETENDAKHAIKFLKENNGGRATFLPVCNIKSREFKEHGFEDMLGYVGIASDLVKTDNKYSEIIKYLLGGAVVAEDIDYATSIAKKFCYRIKVVTLDGQIINPGGSLTGGSLSKNSGLLSRSSDIIKFESELEELQNKFNKTSTLLDSAIESLESIRADITSINAEITVANEDKIRALSELKRIDDLKNNLKESLEKSESEYSASEEKLKQLKLISEESARIIAELDNEKTSIQSEINKMTGGRDNLNSDREKLSLDITSVKLKIIEQSKDYESLLNTAENIKSAISDRNNRLTDINTQISDLEIKNTDLLKEIDEFNNIIDKLKISVSNSEKQIINLSDKRNETEKAGIELRGAEREKTAFREKISGELARLSERKDVMEHEYDDVIRQLYDEYQLTRSDAEKIGIKIEKPTEAKKSLAEIKSKIRALGNVNVSAIEEYKEVSTRYEFMTGQINDIEISRTQLHKLINQLTTQMQEIFTDGFEKINDNFKKSFSELFGGGSASLSLSEPENVLESGIDINVKLPGKNVPSLDGLSGGEKALIALSIYFAIMRVNAPPFCFLDEVDTALDDINVERFANYMKRPDFSTQFICVTHRRGTMEAADMLYGVTMQEKGITKLLELNVSELEKKLLETKGA